MHAVALKAVMIRQALGVRRAVGMVWRSTPLWTLAHAALVVIQGILPLLQLWLMKLIVDGVAEGLSAADKPAAFGSVILWITLAGGAALLSSACGTIAAFVGDIQGQLVSDHVSDMLHSKSAEVDLAYYESPDYYDALHRAQEQTPFRPPRIVNGLMRAGQSGVSLAAMAGLLLSLHWGMAILLFAAALPGTFVRMRFSNKLFNWEQARTPTERKAWYLHWLMATDTAAKEIRLLGLGQLLRKRYNEVRKQLRDEYLRMTVRRSLGEFLTVSLGTIAVFLCCGYIAYEATTGRITLGSLVMYFQAFQRGQGFLQQFLGSLAGLYEDNLYLENLYEFLDLKPQIVDPDQPAEFPAELRTGIAFENVSFLYLGTTRKALENINLEIRPGEHIALVGGNGSGKTTLAKMLFRFYDPSEGRITIDGVDLREFSLDGLRREMSALFQDHVHYYLPAKENIWFGAIHGSADPELVAMAARKSDADHFIRRLPSGYDTILGKWFEEGEELSMGEWQKVALARTFIRNAQIIVLDEPASSLDARSEAEVFRRFRSLAKGRTTILVSHRFSTLRDVDRIHVMEGGRIIESGDHDSLIALGGHYKEMFEIQAESYR